MHNSQVKEEESITHIEVIKEESDDEEEETGPSVDSNDPEERIAARRLRIAKRIEIARR